MKTINVKSAYAQEKDKGFKLAIFDRDDVYEGGELYIADDKVHEVPLTNAVKLAINEGRLVEVDETATAGESTGATGTNVDVDAITSPKPVDPNAKAKAAGEGDVDRVNELYVDRAKDTVDTLNDRYSREELDQLAKNEGVTADELKTAKNKGDVAELILSVEK